MVLERHFQCHGEAAEALGHGIGAHGQVGLAGRRRRIADARLEIRRQPRQPGLVVRQQRQLLVGDRGDTLEAGDENLRNRFIAMHVHRKINAAGLHGGECRQHFGGPGGAGRGPFPIEVYPGGVGAQMAPARAIRVHVRHDVEAGGSTELARHGIGGVHQPLQRALHPPFRHAFAGVLPGIEPDLARAFAQPDAIDWLPFDAVAQRLYPHTGAGADARHQVMVPLHRVGREIGAPQRIGFGRHMDAQRAALGLGIIAGVGAGPALAVCRDGGTVVWPAAGVSAAGQPGDAQGAGLATRAGEAEVEPLVEVAVLVLADAQRDVLRPGAALDDDVAAVKGGGNGNRHGRTCSLLGLHAHGLPGFAGEVRQQHSCQHRHGAGKAGKLVRATDALLGPAFPHDAVVRSTADF